MSEHFVPQQRPLARDTKTKRVGAVMDRLDGWVYLRPQSGGLEWKARPEHVELVNAAGGACGE